MLWIIAGIGSSVQWSLRTVLKVFPKRFIVALMVPLRERETVLLGPLPSSKTGTNTVVNFIWVPVFLTVLVGWKAEIYMHSCWIQEWFLSLPSHLSLLLSSGHTRIQFPMWLPTIPCAYCCVFQFCVNSTTAFVYMCYFLPHVCGHGLRICHLIAAVEAETSFSWLLSPWSEFLLSLSFFLPHLYLLFSCCRKMFR